MKKKSKRLQRYLQCMKQLRPFRVTLKNAALLVVACAIIDILNLPSKILNYISLSSFLLLICVVILVAFCSEWTCQTVASIRRNNVSVIDSVVVECIMAAIVLTGFVFVQEKSILSYKGVLLFSSVAIGLVFLIVRILKMPSEPKNLVNTNLIELSDLFQKSWSRQELQSIQFSDEESNEDLLNRAYLVQLVVHLIENHVKEPSSYVIGIEGEWGSGKSTLINEVKNRLKDNPSIQIVDAIDPWLFETQESFLLALFDEITRIIGIPFASQKGRRIRKQLVSVLSDSSTSGKAIASFFDKSGSLETLEETKRQIDLCLRNSDITYVLVFDNLDRTSSSNVFLVLKLISTFFRLPHLVFLMAYDVNRLNDILGDGKELNPRYLEKVVHTVVKMPMITNSQKTQIFESTLSVLASAIGKRGLNKEIVSELSEELLDVISDLRVYKRTLNSVIPRVLCSPALDTADMLRMEVIHVLEPGLYVEIYNNRRYFIVYNRELNPELWVLSSDVDKFNKASSGYFHELVGRYPSYERLLVSMFPYLKRTLSGSEPIRDTYQRFERDKESENKRTISDFQYFDLYFSNDTNVFLEAEERIAGVIASINESLESDTQNIHDVLGAVFERIPFENQRNALERFENHINDINSGKFFATAAYFLENHHKMARLSEGISLNAKERSLVIVADFLKMMDKQQLDEFKRCYQDKYKFLGALSNVLSYINSGVELGDDYFGGKDCEVILRDMIRRMSNDILSKDIDLFASSMYVWGNVWGLYRYLLANGRENEFTEYVRKHSDSPENIKRVMLEAIYTSTSIIDVENRYGVGVSIEKYKLLGLSDDVINSVLVNELEDDDLLKKCYLRYKNGTKEDYDCERASFASIIRLLNIL